MSDPGQPAIRIGDLSLLEFERLLAGEGAGIRIGPFDGLFRVRVPGIARPRQDHAVRGAGAQRLAALLG